MEHARIPTPIGPATSSTPARPGSATCSKTSATKTLKYLYDFGDGWEHTIKIERLIDPEPGVVYPRLIEVSGRCPPEDCGGPWGYAELLEAIKDPKHERHAELTEWIGDDFDPHADRSRVAHRGSRCPRQEMVTQARNQASAPHLTRGLHRRVTMVRQRRHLFFEFAHSR